MNEQEYHEAIETIEKAVDSVLILDHDFEEMWEQVKPLVEQVEQYEREHFPIGNEEEF